MSSQQGHITVVGMDTSEASQNALRHTLSKAREGDTVHVLYCFTPLMDFVGPEFVKSPSPEQHEQWRLKEQSNFENAIKQVDLTSPAKVETSMLAGDPRSKLLEYAKRTNANEVVVGSHGKGFFSRNVLGSVSSYLSHHSDIPLTIVPWKRSADHPAQQQQQQAAEAKK
ncbi:hypothetical protein PTSG_12877 [Salpingoeca rosetta]|uniref:UspA domain-containing protein n=1 Tax=Salpingoeca rosetta (strain ATCC 50818 / BSB-021) TaxID=946362 RepID=F2UME3_SALR5|nr:uncharacterized protein PTSG_12877 [Salpingoeca rosetta]EGD78292.1 hypothetical protein PTSG_12877 [Salpingoeca rosetta]|eukprot:XP_004989615.1 hypothetical protein PTSG_12877 [Salpingoeca rosetta]